jgi:hypothetical protein
MNVDGDFKQAETVALYTSSMAKEGYDNSI